MDFLLIRPYTAVRGPAFSFHPPLNLACLAAQLEARGLRTEVLDYESEPYDPEALARRIRAGGPLAVGLSAYTNTIVPAAAIARDVKDRCPGLPVIVGGPHATALPERTLAEFPAFDIAVVGEGEATLPCLLAALRERAPLAGIEGIAFREGGRAALTPPRALIPDLDSLPLPDRSRLPPARNDRHFSRGILPVGGEVTSIYTSRGCPHDCVYCAVNTAYPKGAGRVRTRSAAGVNRELELCAGRSGVRHFCFLDDSFSLDRARLLPIAEKLRELGATWNCDIRADGADEDALTLMRRCGCVKVSIGVESGSPRVLEAIRKRVTVAQIREAFRLCRKAGIPIVEGTFMVGSHPDETPEDVEMTVALLRELRPDYACVSVGVPYPGTRLRLLLEERGLIESDDWTRYTMSSLPVWRTACFTAEDLARLQKRIVRGYYLSPRFLLGALRSPRLLPHLLRAGLQFLSR